MYEGRKDKSGKVVFPGYSPGAEAVNGSWNAWITGPTPETNQKPPGPRSRPTPSSTSVSRTPTSTI